MAEPRIVSDMRQWLLGAGQDPYSDREPMVVYQPAGTADEDRIENLDLSGTRLLSEDPDGGRTYSVPASDVWNALTRYGDPGTA